RLSVVCVCVSKFKVVGPGPSFFAAAGSDVVLPCSVRRPAGQSSLSAVDMNITWTRSDLGDALVHFYENHRDVNTRQIPHYRGRTAVFTEELQNGNVSLRLTDVKLPDEGGYKCRVESRSWEGEVSFNLRVEGKSLKFIIFKIKLISLVNLHVTGSDVTLSHVLFSLIHSDWRTKVRVNLFNTFQTFLKSGCLVALRAAVPWFGFRRRLISRAV
uniref:Ig-like domain-containing protein n=1 Tax=Pygocentrus nattereri TaxID=42514 RepID=A0A3B4D4W8_PYGNA